MVVGAGAYELVLTAGDGVRVDRRVWSIARAHAALSALAATPNAAHVSVVLGPGAPNAQTKKSVTSSSTHSSRHASMSIAHIGADTELAAFLHPDDGAAALDRCILCFTASWCGPCHAIAPKFDALATGAGAPACARVDVDACDEAARTYAVRAMPTFVALRDGVEVARVVGADLAQLQDLVDRMSAKQTAMRPLMQQHLTRA